jgi:transcriptional regulator with XRE-family HTH domain
MQDFGEQIRLRRKSLKINQQELANRARVTPRTIYAIEMNKANPTLDVLMRILEELDLEILIDNKKPQGHEENMINNTEVGGGVRLH